MTSTLPRTRPRTRLHVVNEVFDFELMDYTPIPIEVILLNLATRPRCRMYDVPDVVAAQLQPCEDGTIVVRILPVIPKEDAQEALREAFGREGGL